MRTLRGFDSLQPHQIFTSQQLAEEKSGEFTRFTTKSYNTVRKIIDPKVRFPTDDQRVVLALVEFSIQRNKTGNSTKVKNVDVIIPPTTTVARGR